MKGGDASPRGRLSPLATSWRGPCLASAARTSYAVASYHLFLLQPKRMLPALPRRLSPPKEDATVTWIGCIEGVLAMIARRSQWQSLGRFLVATGLLATLVLSALSLAPA